MRVRLLTVGLLLGLLSSCGPSPSYLSFMRRSQKYYSKLADDCDRLLAQELAREGPPVRRLTGDDKSLPSEIRDLHPESVLVGTNAVSIRVGVGRGAYVVMWGPDYFVPWLWKLETNAEGLTRLVYERKKPR